MNADETLINYGHLVKTAVKQIDKYRLPPVIELSDLMQHGYIELLRCAGKYVDDGRAKFSTYADRCIRATLKGVVADAHWGPKHAMQHYRKKRGMAFVPDMISYDSFLEIENEDETLPWIETVGVESCLWDQTIGIIANNKFDATTKHKLAKKILSLLKRKGGVYIVPKTNNSRGGYLPSMRIMGKRIKLGLHNSEQEAKTARKVFLVDLLEKLGPIYSCDEDNNHNSEQEKSDMRERMRARYSLQRNKHRSR